MGMPARFNRPDGVSCEGDRLMRRAIFIFAGVLVGAVLGFFGGDLYYRTTNPNPSAASQVAMLQGINILLKFTPAGAIAGGFVGALWPIKKNQ